MYPVEPKSSICYADEKDVYSVYYQTPAYNFVKAKQL